MDISTKMKYVTYENRNEPHVTIHKVGCNQIAKNGGEGRGKYSEFESLEDAEIYARSTNLKIIYCSFCKILTQKIESLPAGTVIPKPESENDFTVKGVGMRRGKAALVYRIPTNNLEKYPHGHEKGVTFEEFHKAYTVLQKTSSFTREWFDKNLPECAKEGGCNFTTIGGIFELLGIASYSAPGTYTRT